MQAAYSTTADVKAQKAVRREWASYQVWLFDHYRSLENREHEISNATLRKKAKMDKADKQLILGLHEEFLTVARSEWLNRIRHGQLQIQKWIMTPDEKHVLQQTLHWSQKDMLEAYAREQAQIGMKYRRVDPNTLGTKEPTGRPMPSLPKEDRPAYAKWASELSKMSTAPQQRPQPSVKPPELPSLPLYYIGALLQGTDLDTVAASDVEAFALHASEEKIREYYTEACEASVHFQRLLPTLDASERTGAQENFDRRMRDLAIGKERDWKVMTVKELRKYQALEMERRQAQQRAMRPSPRPQIRRDVRDWDYGDVPRRRGVRRRPEQEPEPEYEVSTPPDALPRLRRKNALYRREVYYPPSPEIPFETKPPPEPREIGLRSLWTKWISYLGAWLPERHATQEVETETEATSSVDGTYPRINQGWPAERKSPTRRTRAPTSSRRLRKSQPNKPSLGWDDEEEFPMRTGRSRLKEKFTAGWGLRKRMRRTHSIDSSIGWAQDSE
ncbi:hypothetical protein B0H10DRAFT_2068372 [Mycena sp. CBHHK59/15]|nr:hypothetical protein B0H10DRAFT_2068372 [Mycena sp. CBHHK59/15]